MLTAIYRGATRRLASHTDLQRGVSTATWLRAKPELDDIFLPLVRLVVSSTLAILPFALVPRIAKTVFTCIGRNSRET